MTTAPLSSLPALPCACATIRRASRAVTQFYGGALRDTGLEITQFTLLQALSRAGELTQGQLADLLAMDSTTLTRSLAPLERRGWISSRPGKDRRQRILCIATGGIRRMKSALPAWDKAQSKLRGSLGTDGWMELMRSMDRVTAAAL